jgi:hypothetical protein
LFRHFGFIAPKILNYLAFKSFDFERTWWRLFQKCVVHTKFDIYTLQWYILITVCHWLHFNTGLWLRAKIEIAECQIICLMTPPAHPLVIDYRGEYRSVISHGLQMTVLYMYQIGRHLHTKFDIYTLQWYIDLG